VIPLPDPVASSSGPQRTRKDAKGSRKHNPVKSARKEDDNDEGEYEDGWDATLVQFQAKLHDFVRDGQPSGGLPPEMALVAKITKLLKEDLERSVSRTFYCVLIHRFTNLVISATAAPGHQIWRRKTPSECGGLPRRPTEGSRPSRANLHPGRKRVERE